MLMLQMRSQRSLVIRSKIGDLYGRRNNQAGEKHLLGQLYGQNVCHTNRLFLTYSPNILSLLRHDSFTYDTSATGEKTCSQLEPPHLSLSIPIYAVQRTSHALVSSQEALWSTQPP